MEPEADNQVAAPAETRTPNLHRAKIAHQECGWKGGDSGDSAVKNLVQWKKRQTPLDSDRPSHGRRLHQLRGCWCNGDISPAIASKPVFPVRNI